MGTNKRVFKGKAKTWGLGKASTGTPEVAIEFGVSTPGADMQAITAHLYLSDAALERTVESLRYCGWQGEDVSDGLPGLDANEVELVIEDEEYEGRTFPKVKFINRAGGLALKAPMAEDEAKAFGAQLRDRIRAISATKGDRKPAAKPNGTTKAANSGPLSPEPPPITEKDIPF